MQENFYHFKSLNGDGLKAFESIGVDMLAKLLLFGNYKKSRTNFIRLER